MGFLLFIFYWTCIPALALQVTLRQFSRAKSSLNQLPVAAICVAGLLQSLRLTTGEKRQPDRQVRESSAATISKILDLMRTANPNLAACIEDYVESMQYRYLWQEFGIIYS